MGKLRKSRGERVIDATVAAVEQARGTLVQRLDDIDIDAMRKRGNRLAGSVRADVRRRVQPRRRRVSPWAVVGITGLVVLGAAGVAASYVAYDRERRQAARERFAGVQSRARQRYAELTGGRTQAEADLEARVR